MKWEVLAVDLRNIQYTYILLNNTGIINNKEQIFHLVQYITYVLPFMFTSCSALQKNFKTAKVEVIFLKNAVSKNDSGKAFKPWYLYQMVTKNMLRTYEVNQVFMDLMTLSM